MNPLSVNVEIASSGYSEDFPDVLGVTMSTRKNKSGERLFIG